MTTTVTIKGNLAADPDMRFTQDGTAILNLRVASNRHRKNQQTNEWEDDGEPIFYSVALWGNQADATANLNLQKGSRVLVTGSLKKTIWTHNGKQGETLEVLSATVGLIPRSQNTQQQTQQWGNQPQQQTQPATSTWGGEVTDQPPF